MKKLFRRLMAVAVAAALTAGMCITTSAYTYPSAYWKLHDAWSQAVAARAPTRCSPWPSRPMTC